MPIKQKDIEIVLCVVTLILLFAVFVGLSRNNKSKSVEHATNTRSQSHNSTLRLYYSPSCGHCHSFMPIWDALASELAARNIKCEKINCSEQENVCNAKSIAGYPTIIHTTRDGRDHEFPANKQRTRDNILAFIT